MGFKKSIIILILAIFLFSIASVCASDANDAAILCEDANQIELSSSNEIDEDNLKTSEENTTLTQANDETVSAESESETLGEDEGTFNQLKDEIGNGGNINLNKSYYKYTEGDTIQITTSSVINGNGAVIDMAGSTIQAFNVSASGVTFKNLTIKNVNYGGGGGAIYFDYNSSGSVTNCNFTNNQATGDYSYGGTIYFNGTGDVTNSNLPGINSL